MPDSSDRVLVLDQQIRVLEHALAFVRSKQRWSNLSLVFGPVLLLVLYALWWVDALPRSVLYAIYYPALPLALGFLAASIYLKLRPGMRDESGWVSHSDIELDLARTRDERKLLLASNELPAKVRRIGYKDDAFAEINRMRAESAKYRMVNNLLQGVLIVGALAATGVAGLVGEIPVLRWVALGLTFLVGMASGFMGYFKYKERSFYLQQTADSIESEWEAVEILVGRYKRFVGDDGAALAEFVEEVHRLKSEQKKRQQNLEQPPDASKGE